MSVELPGRNDLERRRVREQFDEWEYSRFTI